MSYYTNSNPFNGVTRSKRQGGNNTVQNVTIPQGYYLGSASNITRLFILVIFLFTILFSFACYHYGKEIGRLEQKIEGTKIVPCISGG